MQEPGIKDEANISEKEKGKIAILAYGSLVGRPGDLKIRGPFEKTDFGMPVGLTRLSKEPPKN